MKIYLTEVLLPDGTTVCSRVEADTWEEAELKVFPDEVVGELQEEIPLSVSMN